MKSFLFVTAVLMLISMETFAQTDSSMIKTPELTIFAGPTIPYLPYPFQNFWKTGFEMGAGVGYSVGSGSWGYGTISCEVNYDRFPFDKTGLTTELKFDPNDDITGDASYAVTALIVAKGTFAHDRHSFAPFFSVGVGYMNVTSGEIRYGTLVARPKDVRGGVAYQLGAGLDIPVTEKMNVFAEGKFLLGFTSQPGRQYFPIVLGGRFTM